MNLRVNFQDKQKRPIWKQIDAIQNTNAQQTKKRRGSKSKFGSSQPKSPQSALKKHLKLLDTETRSMIKQMSRDYGFEDEQAKSETGPANEGHSFMNEIHQQKNQLQIPVKTHTRAVSSSMIHFAPSSNKVQNTGPIESYQKLITNLQKQFTTFQKEILNQLKDLENYYAKMINKLQVRYMEEIDKLKMELSLTSQNIVSEISANQNIEIQPNPEKNEKKHIISRRKPTELKGLTSPKQLKSGSKKQQSHASSLSDLATGIHKQQFKKFAQTFQKMKQEMNEEIPDTSQMLRQMKSDSVRLKI